MFDACLGDVTRTYRKSNKLSFVSLLLCSEESLAQLSAAMYDAMTEPVITGPGGDRSSISVPRNDLLLMVTDEEGHTCRGRGSQRQATSSFNYHIFRTECWLRTQERAHRGVNVSAASHRTKCGERWAGKIDCYLANTRLLSNPTTRISGQEGISWLTGVCCPASRDGGGERRHRKTALSGHSFLTHLLHHLGAFPAQILRDQHWLKGSICFFQTPAAFHVPLFFKVIPDKLVGANKLLTLSWTPGQGAMTTLSTKASFL